MVIFRMEFGVVHVHAENGSKPEVRVYQRQTGNSTPVQRLQTTAQYIQTHFTHCNMTEHESMKKIRGQSQLLHPH